jgi:AraC family transcriptional regulator, transcriptional activator of pobA
MKNIFPTYNIGHFINQPNNPTPFEISFFENMDEPDIEDPHKHNFYEIIWTDAGKSRHWIDYNEYVLEPNSLFFISPNQLHAFEEWEHLKGGSIFFTEDFFLLNQSNKDKLFELTFLDNFYSNPALQLNNANFSSIRLTIELISREKSRADYSQNILQSLLHVLLEQIQRCVISGNRAGNSTKYTVLYKQFKGLIEQHFADNLTVSDYAERLFVTAHHLNVVSKNVTGKTAGEVIRARTLLEAKRYLTYSDYSVTEIATALNYFDSSYFSKIFRAEIGQSPLKFKKQMSEKYRKHSDST